MTIERDAAYLCGFIAGTYDLRGEGELPALIKPYVDRIMVASGITIPTGAGRGEGSAPPALPSPPAPVEARAVQDSKPIEIDGFKTDHIPDATKMVKPAQTVVRDHIVEVTTMKKSPEKRGRFSDEEKCKIVR